jgi:hypothetical protein
MDRTLAQPQVKLSLLHNFSFMGSLFPRDLSYQVESHNATVNGCRGACRAAFYRYAGVQAGRLCFCGSEYGRHGPGTCNMRCEGNAEQTCGGSTANAIFRTGFNGKNKDCTVCAFLPVKLL